MEKGDKEKKMEDSSGVHSSSFSQDTLVKYSYPVIVSIHEKTEISDPKTSPRELDNGLRDGKIIDLEKRQTEEALNIILPPREWMHNGQLWRQMVSSTPAKRSEVIALEEQLNIKLKQRQARPFGICPIRRELYSQCFDELIRQVAINCAERGMLLMKVRDEICMSMKAYRALYESAIGHGIRKCLMEQATKSQLTSIQIMNNNEKSNLELQVQEMERKLEDLEQMYKEEKEADDMRHEEEMDHLTAINEQIKQKLESIIIPPKKGAEAKP